MWEHDSCKEEVVWVMLTPMMVMVMTLMGDNERDGW